MIYFCKCPRRRNNDIIIKCLYINCWRLCSISLLSFLPILWPRTNWRPLVLLSFTWRSIEINIEYSPPTSRPSISPNWLLDVHDITDKKCSDLLTIIHKKQTSIKLIDTSYLHHIKTTSNSIKIAFFFPSRNDPTCDHQRKHIQKFHLFPFFFKIKNVQDTSRSG